MWQGNKLICSVKKMWLKLWPSQGGRFPMRNKQAFSWLSIRYRAPCHQTCSDRGRGARALRSWRGSRLQVGLDGPDASVLFHPHHATFSRGLCLGSWESSWNQQLSRIKPETVIPKALGDPLGTKQQARVLGGDSQQFPCGISLRGLL